MWYVWYEKILQDISTKNLFYLKWLVPTNIIHKLRFRFPFNNNYKWKNDEGKIFQTYAILWFLLKIYDLTNNYHEPTTSKPHDLQETNIGTLNWE